MTTPGDFYISASSARFPLVAAGLINSAVGALLQQLSLQFFELALTPSSTVKTNENPTNPDEVLSLSDNTVRKEQEDSQHSQYSSLECALASCSVVLPDISQSPKFVDYVPEKSTASSSAESVVDITSLMNMQAAEEEEMSVSTEIDVKPEQDYPMGLNVIASKPVAIKPEDSPEEISDRRSVGVGPEQSEPPAKFPCLICGKVLSSKRSMLRHLRNHSTYRPYRCGHPGCTDRFKTAQALNHHSKVHLPKKERLQFHCSYPGCKKSFFHKESLSHHTTLHSGEPMFNCDHPGCTQRFFYRRNLVRHQLTHLDDQHRPRFKCKHPGCGRSFPYATDLSKHMLVHGSGKYVCDYPGCGKQYVKKSGLKAHRWRHTVGKNAKDSDNDSNSSASSSCDVSVNAESVGDGDGDRDESVIVVDDGEENPMTPDETALPHQEPETTD